MNQCQRIINRAVHEATGEQPHFLMFNRRAPRIIRIELPQMGQDSELEVALELVKRTSREQASKWRNRANIGRKNQKVEIDQQVWIKRDYATSQSDKKLGVKWVGPYKVKEVLRGGRAYRLENVFDGVIIQRAADKIKPYVGQEGILIQEREVFFHREKEEEEDDEPRPVRERRLPARYREEDEGRIETEEEQEPAREEIERKRERRPVRERRPPRRYMTEDGPMPVTRPEVREDVSGRLDDNGTRGVGIEVEARTDSDQSGEGARRIDSESEEEGTVRSRRHTRIR